MRHSWVALAACVLVLGALAPRTAGTQGTPTPPAREHSQPLALGQNYPNPFNPSTTIPFAVGDFPACTDGGRPHRVSLRIYNLLAQLVAIPILQGDPAPGQPVQSLTLRCGTYTAFWNGNYLSTSKEAASGVYLYRLEVDGKTIVKTMLVTK